MKAEEIEKILFDHFFKRKSPEEPWYQAEAYPKRTCQKAAAEIEAELASELSIMQEELLVKYEAQLAAKEAEAEILHRDNKRHIIEITKLQAELATMREALKTIKPVLDQWLEQIRDGEYQCDGRILQMFQLQVDKALAASPAEDK